MNRRFDLRVIGFIHTLILKVTISNSYRTKKLNIFAKAVEEWMKIVEKENNKDYEALEFINNDLRFKSYVSCSDGKLFE